MKTTRYALRTYETVFAFCRATDNSLHGISTVFQCCAKFYTQQEVTRFYYLAQLQISGLPVFAQKYEFSKVVEIWNAE